MDDFDYDAPTTLTAALARIASANGSARPLVGGTDLLDQLRTRRIAAGVVVDLKRVPELQVLARDESGLRLGAAVPCYRISGSSHVARDYSALADSCRIIGGIQIQSRASVGGNLCNASPAADSVPSVIALGGVCIIDGPAGRRELPAEAFCVGPGTNALAPGELLVEIRLPPRPRRSGSHYRRMIPRNEMDIAVVGVAASVVLDESGDRFVSARVALGAVAPTPLLAVEAGQLLAGQPVDDDTIGRAADAARAAATPITDMRGTREYRTHATGVLTARVLRTAVARARGESIAALPVM